MVLAYYTQNYCLFLLIELFTGVLNSAILNHIINQTYPWLESNIQQGKHLFKNIQK